MFKHINMMVLAAAFIFTPGQAFSQVPCAPSDATCPGSEAYCKSEAYYLEPICVVGTQEYCKQNGNSALPVCTLGSPQFCGVNIGNPACLPGQPEFCKLEQHTGHEQCPGNASSKNSMIENIAINQDAGNGATSYQVNITTQSTAIGVVLCTMVYYVKSDIGQAVATLAILMLAISLLYGKASWKMVLVAGVGIAAIFGAAQLAFYVGSNVAGFSTTLACLKAT